MSYQVIARKWRPQTFEEVTGQEPITHALRNAIELERLHHAYLFSGARGVGKTTTARLLAKALNCHKTPKPNPSPCNPEDKNACVSCKEITEGRSIDVQEIDAASNTGVQNVRDSIIDTINIRAARDRYKVFIIDEVHQLSKQAFDALLKTLEEPPPNVAFILATTELHKVPDTILSRCQEFLFRTIPTLKIYERLKLIADTEKVDVEDDALREIARSGEGSMRDAQSNFDQVISFCGDKITTSDVVASLGLASSEILRKTITAVASQNAKEILVIVEEMISRGQDLRAFCRDFLAFVRDLLVAKISEKSDQLIESSIVPFEELRKIGADFSETDLLRFFNLLAETELKLRSANEPRYALEIGLLKLVEARRLVSLETILSRLAALEGINGVAQEISDTEPLAKSTASQSSSMETAEKKTLISKEISVANSEPTVSRSVETSGDRNSYSAARDFESAIGAPISRSDLDFVLPHRHISSDELAHAEDNYLDFAFEDRLRREGDLLGMIHDAHRIVARLFLSTENNQIEVETAKRAAAGIATSDTTGFFKPSDPEGIESVSVPALPVNPTEEDLREYAENHPKIKTFKKLLRARIVGVTRPETPLTK